MTKMSSASGAADKDTVIEAMPYGTRSRNRTANSRPNYAEDKDIEMDMYDYYPDKKDSDAGKKPSRQTNGVGNGETARANGSSRKNAAAAADDSKATPSQNGSQDAKSGGTIHASQATSGTGTSQPSRKRKAAANQNGGAAAAASTATSAAATPPASTTAASKKNALAAQAQLQGMTWPESNMLTFETCKGLPDNGRMVADDGTVLEANGR